MVFKCYVCNKFKCKNYTFAFLWGLLKTLTVIVNLVVSHGKDPLAAINLIELMDIFLIATVLYIFGAPGGMERPAGNPVLWHLYISNAMNIIEAVAAESSQSHKERGTVPNTSITCGRYTIAA